MATRDYTTIRRLVADQVVTFTVVVVVVVVVVFDDPYPFTFLMMISGLFQLISGFRIFSVIPDKSG